MLYLRMLSVVAALSTCCIGCSIGGQGQLHRPLQIVFERGFDGHRVAIVSHSEIVFEDTLYTFESVGHAGSAKICKRAQLCSFGIIVNDSLLQSLDIDTEKWYAVTVNLRDNSILELDTLDFEPIYD